MSGKRGIKRGRCGARGQRDRREQEMDLGQAGDHARLGLRVELKGDRAVMVVDNLAVKFTRRARVMARMIAQLLGTGADLSIKMRTRIGRIDRNMQSGQKDRKDDEETGQHAGHGAAHNSNDQRRQTLDPDNSLAGTAGIGNADRRATVTIRTDRSKAGAGER